jgi:hypothetical protein
MGNKIDIDSSNRDSSTPKNKSSLSNSQCFSSKKKSAQKDGLFTEEKLFENFDSI